ncbi:MAG: hypothetical protein AVDCRST_MAG39-1008 [uncultured Sphingomonadaceae bacterium]|uniref:DUF465 domain-containing protein n=1 Tax=uncultured Sphingomonadaceae bacterium TaxID=169976 RepID=A0A6J4SBC9_9SPHN|nr:MAG: hypothetical protein AVDCRST_MAG39-1008 [uncultured Sphingomonadaceae bacterium]
MRRAVSVGGRGDGKDFGLEEDELRERLERLRCEHRDLDAAIDALLARQGVDQLQVARMKRRKLLLKDEIAQVGDQLIPDIIA